MSRTRNGGSVEEPEDSHRQDDDQDDSQDDDQDDGAEDGTEDAETERSDDSEEGDQPSWASGDTAPALWAESDARFHSGMLGPLTSGPLRDGRIYRDTPLLPSVRQSVNDLARRAWRATEPPPPGIDTSWVGRNLPPLSASPASSASSASSALPPTAPLTPLTALPPLPPLTPPSLQPPHGPPAGADERTLRVWRDSPAGQAYEAFNRYYGAFAFGPYSRRQPPSPTDPRLVPAGRDAGPRDPSEAPPPPPSMGSEGGTGPAQRRRMRQSNQPRQQGAEGAGGAGGMNARPRGWSYVGPGGPGAYAAQVAVQEEVAMHAVIQASRPYQANEEPPNICAMALWAPPGLRVTVSRDLPANVLGALYIARRRIALNEELFPSVSQLTILRRALVGQSETAARRFDWWYPFIEDNMMARFVLASLFTAFYHHPALVAAAVGRGCTAEYISSGGRINPVWQTYFSVHSPLLCALAPVNAWSKAFSGGRMGWHTRYYTAVWQKVLSLLVNAVQLDAQTRSYLDLADDEPPPRGRDLMRALYAAAPMPSGTERVRYGMAREDNAVLALRRAGDQRWAHYSYDRYIDALAAASNVPRILPLAKLGGAFAHIASGEDLSALTRELIAQDERMLHRRMAVATQRDERRHALGYGLKSPEDVGLYLAEPARLIPTMGYGEHEEW